MTAPPPPPIAASQLVKLYRALIAENLTFPSFTLILHVYRQGGASISVARLSVETGTSYHATRHQISRTPWFIVSRSGPLSFVTLTPEAVQKLHRMAKRLAPEGC